MARTVKVITALTREQTESLKSQRNLEGFDNMPHIHPRIKDAIRGFMADNVGYDKAPLAALSRYNNSNGELSRVKSATDVSEYLPVRAGAILFELHMPEDMVVSVAGEDLIYFTKMLNSSSSDDLADLYMEEFKDRIHLGYIEGEDDIVSFLPFIDRSRCKFFAHIDRSWNISELDIPGVEQVKLANMSMF